MAKDAESLREDYALVEKYLKKVESEIDELEDQLMEQDILRKELKEKKQYRRALMTSLLALTGERIASTEYGIPKMEVEEVEEPVVRKKIGLTPVTMHNVDSSNVRAVGYDPIPMRTYVTFHNGATYVYESVPEDEYRNLKNASSVGEYLNKRFKYVYPYKRVDERKKK